MQFLSGLVLAVAISSPGLAPEHSLRLVAHEAPLERGSLTHLWTARPTYPSIQESGASTRDAARRSWISRHPALFGALVGAGGGAIAAGTMQNELFCSGGDEDCFFHGPRRVLLGAGMGAGIGALIGWIGGR
jgi:hypothetical protein